MSKRTRLRLVAYVTDETGHPNGPRIFSEINLKGNLKNTDLVKTGAHISIRINTLAVVYTMYGVRIEVMGQTAV